MANKNITNKSSEYLFFKKRHLILGNGTFTEVEMKEAPYGSCHKFLEKTFYL